MLVTLSGIVMLERFIQLLKAKPSMVVRVLGSVILERLSQPEKPEYGIVSPEVITTVCKLSLVNHGIAIAGQVALLKLMQL